MKKIIFIFIVILFYSQIEAKVYTRAADSLELLKLYDSTDGSNWASIATNIAYRAGIEYIYVDGNLTEGQRYY